MTDCVMGVRTFSPNASAAAVAAIVEHCGIALQKTSSSLAATLDQV